DEDPDRRLAPLLGGHSLLARRDQEHLQPIDVALGDAVRRIEPPCRLVVLPRGPKLTELPQRLREAVLGLGVLAELEQFAVRRRGIGPLGGGRLGDRLVGQLALLAREVDGSLGRRLDVGEGHGAVVLSGRGGGRAGGGGRKKGARSARWGGGGGGGGRGKKGARYAGGGLFFLEARGGPNKPPPAPRRSLRPEQQVP